MAAAPPSKPIPPLPPPPPAPPPPPVEQRDSAAKALAVPAKGPFRLLHPLVYIKGFIEGTIDHALDGTANWGRHGTWLGLIAGIGLGITTGTFFGAALLGATVGLAVGGLAGGAVGLATGGIMGVRRQWRAEKYADDLLVKETQKQSPGVGKIDYYGAHQLHRQQQNYILDRVMQQEREVQRESHYWRDHVSHDHGGHGGHGL